MTFYRHHHISKCRHFALVVVVVFAVWLFMNRISYKLYNLHHVIIPQDNNFNNRVDDHPLKKKQQKNTTKRKDYYV